MSALRPASQAGPMRNPREGTSVVLRDTICAVCSCCGTSPYREMCRAKEGIGSGETLCNDIYPARSSARWTRPSADYFVPLMLFWKGWKGSL